MPSLQLDLLAERVADALRHGALDLALDALHVDRPADVVAGDVVDDPHLTRLDVHLDVGARPRRTCSRARCGRCRCCSTCRTPPSRRGRWSADTASRRATRPRGRARRGAACSRSSPPACTASSAQVSSAGSAPSSSAATGSSSSREARAPPSRRRCRTCTAAAWRRCRRRAASSALSPMCTAVRRHGAAEDLAGDVGERRRLPGAEVGDTGADHERAVPLEPDPRAGVVVHEHVAPVRVRVGGDPAADADAWAGRGAAAPPSPPSTASKAVRHADLRVEPLAGSACRSPRLAKFRPPHLDPVEPGNPSANPDPSAAHARARPALRRSLETRCSAPCW